MRNCFFDVWTHTKIESVASGAVQIVTQALFDITDTLSSWNVKSKKKTCIWLIHYFFDNKEFELIWNIGNIGSKYFTGHWSWWKWSSKSSSEWLIKDHHNDCLMIVKRKVANAGVEVFGIIIITPGSAYYVTWLCCTDAKVHFYQLPCSNCTKWSRSTLLLNVIQNLSNREGQINKRIFITITCILHIEWLFMAKHQISIAIQKPGTLGAF